ncbi:MAG: nitrate/nitrite transporter NrtS [Solirubrobacterales bacterium]
MDGSSEEEPMATGEAWSGGVRDAVAICMRREHLRRTLRIALVVGLILTLINQADVIIGGDAGAATWVKVGLNFCVPFVVSNLGLLAGKRGER